MYCALALEAEASRCRFNLCVKIARTWSVETLGRQLAPDISTRPTFVPSSRCAIHVTSNRIKQFCGNNAMRLSCLEYHDDAFLDS